MVHLVVAVDEAGRRRTERLWNLPLVNEAYFTVEAKPSSSGTRAAIYYSFKTGIPIAGQIAKSIFIRNTRGPAERDMQGLKSFYEAEVRALDAPREAAKRRAASAQAGQPGARATSRPRAGVGSRSTPNARSGSTASATRLSAAIAT